MLIKRFFAIASSNVLKAVKPCPKKREASLENKVEEYEQYIENKYPVVVDIEEIKKELEEIERIHRTFSPY